MPYDQRKPNLIDGAKETLARTRAFFEKEREMCPEAFEDPAGDVPETSETTDSGNAQNSSERGKRTVKRAVLFTPDEDQRIQEYRGDYYMKHQVMLTHTGVIRHLVEKGLERYESR